jgi:hypothetical protein
MPSVILVLLCCLAGLQLSSQHLRLQDVSAIAARSIARGEGVGSAAQLAAQLVPGTQLSTASRGSSVCVTASAPGLAVGGVLPTITLRASSCAPGAGA